MLIFNRFFLIKKAIIMIPIFIFTISPYLIFFQFNFPSHQFIVANLFFFIRLILILASVEFIYLFSVFLYHFLTLILFFEMLIFPNLILFKQMIPLNNHFLFILFTLICFSLLFQIPIILFILISFSIIVFFIHYFHFL